MVTEKGPVPACQHRGHLSRQRRQHRVAHDVDAPMYSMQPSAADAVPDRPATQAQGDELRPRDDAVLVSSEFRDRWVAMGLDLHSA